MHRRLVILGVFAVLAVPGARAAAQSPIPAPTPSMLPGPSPVTISACVITRRPRFRNRKNPYPLPVTGGLQIGFVNRGTSAAKEIRFHVDYRGESEMITDAGNFAPGALFSHSFENFSDYAYLGPTPNVCGVVMVRFADGTVWNSITQRQFRRPL